MIKLASRFVFFFGIAFLFYCCGNETETTDENRSTLQDQSSRYGNLTYQYPILSENVKKQIAQWTVYDDFENEIKSINGSTLQELKYRSQRLLTTTDSLSKKLPDTVATKFIISRLVVLRTRANLLVQELNKQRIDSASVQNVIVEMNTATRNFIFQLNEKFEKAAIDMQKFETEEKAIEKQKRIRDSILQQEIKDKKQ